MRHARLAQSVSLLDSLPPCSVHPRLIAHPVFELTEELDDCYDILVVQLSICD
jgi:hypothetical protein